MLAGINIWLWLALIPSYFAYEYVGTKNIISTNKLRAGEASNTGALMYVIGILGTYLCVTEGLINIIPILIGSWLGTYYSVKAEIKLVKKRKCKKEPRYNTGFLEYFKWNKKMKSPSVMGGLKEEKDV